MVATLSSLDDKKRVMAAKASLKDNRIYKDVYIHNDQARRDLMYAANLRSLVNAYRSGDSNMRVRGSRIVPEEIENTRVSTGSRGIEIDNEKRVLDRNE